MNNFILQSLDGKINLSAKKVSIVGMFTPTQTEKPNQFANELSQLMETASSYNVSEIESLQNERLNIFPNLLDNKIVGSDTKQEKNLLLKAFENRNITLDNNSEIPEILSSQGKQNVLTSDQSLFVDNIGYKAITKDGKNNKLESVLKSKVSIEVNRQINENVSENIILSAMIQQLPTNIVPEQNPQAQEYKQLNTKMEDNIRLLISNQNTIKIEPKSEQLMDNSSLSVSLIQDTIINNQIKPVITDQDSIQIEAKSKPLIDNNAPIVPTIPNIQKEAFKANGEEIITNEKSMLQYEGKPQLQNEQNIDLNIQNPKEQIASNSYLFANYEYIKENKVENYSVVSSDISTPDKALLISYPIKIKQDTIQKPIDSVKSTINLDSSKLSTSSDTPMYVSVYTPEMNELPNIKQSESRQVIGSFQRSQVIINNALKSSYTKETESGEYANNSQFDAPIITPDKENRTIEQYELRQNISPIQNPNIQIKLSPKQIYNLADISTLKTSIIESENGSASIIKQAEPNDNNVSVEYSQVKTEQKDIEFPEYSVENNLHGKFLNLPSPLFQRRNDSISIEEDGKMDLAHTQNSLQTTLIEEFVDNLTSKKSETIFENNNISENIPIEQGQYIGSERNTQKTSEVIDIINKSNTKTTEIIPDRKNIPFDNLIEPGQNDITIHNKPPKIENESNQFPDQPKNDNTLSNKNELQSISQAELENIDELIPNTQRQIEPNVKIANNELPKLDKIVNNSQIDIPINLSKESEKQLLPQIRQKQNIQADLSINGNVNQKINPDQPILMDNLIIPQTKHEQDIQTDSQVYGNTDQKLDSDKPILAEESINRPAMNLPKKSLENVIINNVDDKYEQDILPPTSDKKTPESKPDIGQTIKTQIITDGLLFNKSESQSNNKNAQNQQKSMINQAPAKDNQAQKTNNQKDISVELDEIHKYNIEKPNSPKLIENQNVKIDNRQPDDYVQEKPVQMSSNSVMEQDKSSKTDSQKNSENNPYITTSDTVPKQETKDNIFQEKQRIGYERRLNIENNRPTGKIDNIEANNIIDKNDVLKDKSSEIISPKIMNVKKANTDKTTEKFEIPSSRVNNDFVSTQKTDVRNIPVTDKNEMTSKVLELPDSITQYINTVKNDTKPQSVMIQLEPANLGKIKLKVSVKDNKLIAEMSVASLATKEIIEAQLPDIKRSLMQYDLQVSGFNVTLDNGSSKFGSFNPNSSQQGKWSSESLNYNRGDENNSNSHEHTKRYMRYVNNDSMVDILT